MARSVAFLAAHLRGSEAAARGSLRQLRVDLGNGLLGDNAARSATLPALLRATMAPAASGGVRFSCSRAFGDDCQPPTKVIYPQALKDQLEKERKQGEGLAVATPTNCSPCPTKQRDNDTKLSTMRIEFEKKLVSQSADHEVRMAAMRTEFEGKLTELRREYELKLTALGKEKDEKFDTLKAIVEGNHKEVLSRESGNPLARCWIDKEWFD
ncbi:hypothetical protein PR202_gb18968 [Eleusine coracana subsp. coracana]|uniref:Uncharacterized protein n=1 Tax=Eleusine coracana subsp. coracana TaxID=191504 RepID=A0AAV5F4R4_ELECO|nr:hypothetical protein PR202_gb18968 [Eleusine coracana subsp. coracana]